MTKSNSRGFSEDRDAKNQVKRAAAAKPKQPTSADKAARDAAKPAATTAASSPEKATPHKASQLVSSIVPTSNYGALRTSWSSVPASAGLASRGIYFDDLPFDPSDLRQMADAYSKRAAALRSKTVDQPAPQLTYARVPSTLWSGSSGSRYRSVLEALTEAVKDAASAYDAIAAACAELAEKISVELTTFRQAASEFASVHVDGQGATPAQSAALDAAKNKASAARHRAIFACDATVTKIVTAAAILEAASTRMAKYSSAEALGDPVAQTNTRLIVKPGTPKQTYVGSPGSTPSVFPQVPPGFIGPVLRPVEAPPLSPSAIPNDPGLYIGKPQIPSTGNDTDLTPTAIPSVAPRPTKYTVQSGNSWWQISDWTLRQVGLTPTGAQVMTYMKALQAENKPGPDAYLKTGRVLTLPSPADVLGVVIHDTP